MCWEYTIVDKRSSRENFSAAIANVQTMGDGVSDLEGSKGGKKWWDSGYILKVKLVLSLDMCDVGNKRKMGVKDDFKDFFWENKNKKCDWEGSKSHKLTAD